MNFTEKLLTASRKNRSLLCVGLDPDPELMPSGVSVFEFNRAIIDATSDLVCAYKLNLAFYEVLDSEGLDALKRTIKYIPDDIPVIGDAKRGDIGNTAKAYARAIFDNLNFDATTVNPYLGFDSIEPFIQYADKGVFIICRTSSVGAIDFQALTVIYPLLSRCKDVKAKFDTNYFAQDYRAGWPEIYGLSSGLSDEEVKILSIGTFEGRQVLSFPEPSLGILIGRFYSGVDMMVWLPMPRFEQAHKDIADRVDEFDSRLPQLDKLLRSLAVEVKKIIIPYVGETEVERTLASSSALDKGRFVSYITEICFNYLLLTPKDFSAFLGQFERDQAKDFWKESEAYLQALLTEEHIKKQVSKLKTLSSQLYGELSNIYNDLFLLKEAEPSYPLFEIVALKASQWNTHGNIGLVVGATYPEELRLIRQSHPDMPLLIPGIGAQGGELASAVRYGVDSQGEKAIISSSRQIIYASREKDFAEAARRVASKLREQINQYRSTL